MVGDAPYSSEIGSHEMLHTHHLTLCNIKQTLVFLVVLCVMNDFNYNYFQLYQLITHKRRPASVARQISDLQSANRPRLEAA